MRSIALFALIFSGENAVPEAAPSARSTLTLVEAYQLALAYSERVKVAEQAVAVADLEHTAAWTELGPVAQISATGGWITQPPLQDGWIVSGGGSLNQPLFRRGFFGQRDAGELGIKNAEASLARSKEQLLRDVVVAFIGVLRARQQIDLFKSAVNRATTQQQSAAAKVKAGGALKTAELLATLDLRRAQIQLNAAERDARTQEAIFKFLVGEAPPATLTLPETPEVPAREQALELRKEKRSDLRAARIAVLQSRALEDAASGRRLWPRLDASVQANRNYFKDGSNTDWLALGLLTFPLFETGAEYLAISAQEYATRVLELEEQLLLKTSSDEVVRAAIQVEAQDRAAELAEAQVKDAQDNYQLVAAQFRLGAITFLDVANAQAVLTESENLRVVAVYDREIARYEFLFSAGLLSLDR